MENNLTDVLKVDGINCKGYGLIAKAVMQDVRIHIIAKGIYAYFCSYAGNGDSAFPKKDKICHDLGINKDTLNKNLKYLNAYGYITHQQAIDGKGKFKSNIYRIVSNPLENEELIKQLEKLKLKKQIQNEKYSEKSRPCMTTSVTVYLSTEKGSIF